MARRRQSYQRQGEKSKTFAAILAVFFGGLGAHKFYLRDPGAGILYLMIMFITSRIMFPLSIFLGWFDALRLFTMSQAQFDRKYNRHIERSDDYYEEQQQQRSSRRSRRDTRELNRSQRNRRREPVSDRMLQKANPFKKSGLKKYKEFDLSGAIEDFNQGLKIAPRDIALHFNLACAYSLTEKKDKAFEYLSKAVSLGYNDFDKIQSHDDLAFLRIQTEFEDFKKNGYVLSKSQTFSAASENATSKPETEIKDDVLLSQLNKLAELRKKGLLTENEFMMERKKLLRQ